MKEGGHNTLRFSIAWTRILPDQSGQVNPEGVAFYKDVLKECRENGITPNVTLLHYDIPAWLEDLAGMPIRFSRMNSRNTARSSLSSSAMKSRCM